MASLAASTIAKMPVIIYRKCGTCLLFFRWGGFDFDFPLGVGKWRFALVESTISGVFGMFDSGLFELNFGTIFIFYEIFFDADFFD